MLNEENPKTKTQVDRNSDPLLRYTQYEEQLAKTRKANKEQEAATAVPEVMKDNKIHE